LASTSPKQSVRYLQLEPATAQHDPHLIPDTAFSAALEGTCSI
jgi:hypothetical protein